MHIKIFTIIILSAFITGGGTTRLSNHLPVAVEQNAQSGIPFATDTIPVLEPWIYSDDFEDRDLGAWASYPLWQDNAYNQNFRVNEIISGDPNISIVQKVTPYTHVDNYAGAQKLLDMYLVPGATVRFRYYLKSNIPAEWFKIRFAAGNELGKLDFTITSPELNHWKWMTISYDDFAKENPAIAGKQIKIYALAFLTKFPMADPDMPLYLGLDDITFSGAREFAFKFNEPEVIKLPEFKPYIPKRPFHIGDEFQLKGSWMKEAEKVTMRIVPYFNRDKVIYEGSLVGNQETWQSKKIKLNFPEGLYLATVTAYKGKRELSSTGFTIHIAPQNIGKKHPRLLFDEQGKEEIVSRFRQSKYQGVYQDILKQAERLRKSVPVKSLVYDLDQFPDENWLPTWDAWGSRIYPSGEAVRWNARAYTFHQDTVAGRYVVEVLLKLAEWPDWTHPWQTKRGRFSEHRTGSWAHRLAEAYDLVYPMMNEQERLKIRKALMKNIIQGVHRTYVYNDNVTSGTSNWLAMTVGGSLMNMAAIFEDGEETENLEPYFTGAIFKLDKFLHNVTDSKDGAWGEGFGYNNYSFQNLSYSLPSLENVFHIDMSAPIRNTYNEYIWGGIIKEKRWFEYGDSGGEINSLTNWAYLLGKYRDPRLSWFYHFIQNNNQSKTSSPGEEKGHGTERFEYFGDNSNLTFEDVVFGTENIPQSDPFNENPVKAFHGVGTTVFKGSWNADDFVFVMRTGPFYNHQHLDQGSFWLADKGETFIEERPLSNSHYYDDPIYESWLTQPIGHSTILVNGNHQSQRTGDPKNFAPGFNDYAFIERFLDGEKASFVTGDIGRLYWGKVKSLTRNVLFIKPNRVLMLDVAEPANEDAEINLLYQTKRLKDIQVNAQESIIIKDKSALHIMHLHPENVKVESVETPHYLKTLLNVRPLEKEGMLTVTGRTSGKPLVMANLLTTIETGRTTDISIKKSGAYIEGVISADQSFVFTTQPGETYQYGDISTDALSVMTGKESRFVAKASTYKDPQIQLAASTPITFESTAEGIHYTLSQSGDITIQFNNPVAAVKLNGKPVGKSEYNKTKKELRITLPEGEGWLSFK